MRLGEVKDLPEPREIKGKASIDGKQGGIYSINNSDGDNFTLRNFSSSVNDTNSKWNIDINQKGKYKIEFKFQ